MFSQSQSAGDEVEKPAKRWLSEPYGHQSREVWPGRGQHILAQYDDDSVVVYQAFNDEIADYAVAHQRFTGCPEYNPTRMTWIKANFLWMMFRAGWARKPNQNRILAIWLKRPAFERYLERARTKGSSRERGCVRLQWDPDHFPNGDCHPYRRAVQLGLRGIETFASGEDILQISDVTQFVRVQADIALHKKATERTWNEQLVVARERVFMPNSYKAALSVQISGAESHPEAIEQEQGQG